MIINVKPDREKAKSMLVLVEERIKTLPFLKKSGFPNIVAETYYEIFRGLSGIFLLSSGFKSVGENYHKDLFEFLFRKKFLAPKEFFLINDLRVRRNNSFYQGKRIHKVYLERKEGPLDAMIKKLKTLIKNKLREKRK